MTTTPTPSPEAEALPTLPVVAWSMAGTNASFISAEAKDANSECNWAMFYTTALTPHAPAEAVIVALRAEVERLTMQVENLSAESQLACEIAERLTAEVAELRKERDAAMVRLDTALATCNDWFKANGPGGWIDELRRRASLLGDGGTL